LGAAGEIEWDNSRPVVRTLAALDFPAHIEPVDLNLDGAKGFLVAELGSREPADHDRGKVVWLRPETPEGFLSIPLQEGLGRVADVQAADFDGDGDGDLDLVVAEFGWHTTGRILLLRNQSGQGPEPQFTLEVVDERHGAIHVPVADLNRDGHPDFVALVSQEHEVVDAFLNKGDGTFWKERLYDAGDPSRGSSGIELIDIDGDGDLDVVHTNGDSFDSYYVKPYHGIRWLENTGSFPFLVHELTAFPGVHRAMAADLDGDGDMDIVACAFLPEQLEDGADRQAFNSVIWLEQVAPGQFVRHVIEHGNPSHATLVLADFDEDGDIDVVVGNFASNDGEASPLATIYWNERISNR
jgi:hypothetical protein